MATITKIQKWGNSLAVRLPKNFIRALALKEGSEVYMREVAEQIVIMPHRAHERMHTLADWRKFIIPRKRTGKRTGTLSKDVDNILYGDSR